MASVPADVVSVAPAVVVSPPVVPQAATSRASIATSTTVLRHGSVLSHGWSSSGALREQLTSSKIERELPTTIVTVSSLINSVNR